MSTSLYTPIIWDAADSSIHSVQNVQEYFKRPIKRGNPSHANWNRMAEIIKYNIESISPNADFDEISRIVEELAKINDISLNKWAVSYFTKRILDLYCCLNYLCQLETSDNSTIRNCFELTENESSQLSLFNLCQFKELTKKQQIIFLLSHVSLVKEICKQFKFEPIMKKRNKLLIKTSLVPPKKLSDFLSDISEYADFSEATGEIIYDNDEEVEKKIVEILDKYFS